MAKTHKKETDENGLPGAVTQLKEVKTKPQVATLELVLKHLDMLPDDDLAAIPTLVAKVQADRATLYRAEARKAAEAATAQYGLTVEDIALGGKKSKTPKNPPKYRNPENHKQTWSGRGRHPGWLNEMLEQGPVDEVMERCAIPGV